MSEFEQRASRVGARSRGRAAVLGWAAALAAIVGLAAAGGDHDRGERDPAAVGTAPPAAVGPTVAPSTVLTLTEPEPDHSRIETVAVWVRGRADAHVQDVELVLVRGGTAVSRQTVPTSSRGTFSGVFTLGAPRPAGTFVVVAIGRDESGVPVERVERDVRVAPLRRAFLPTADLGMRPPRVGEDGVLGSRGVDLTQLGTPALRAGRPGSVREGRLGPPRTQAMPAVR